jgi:hypothetical protein
MEMRFFIRFTVRHQSTPPILCVHEIVDELIFTWSIKFRGTHSYLPGNRESDGKSGAINIIVRLNTQFLCLTENWICMQIGCGIGQRIGCGILGVDGPYAINLFKIFII